MPEQRQPDVVATRVAVVVVDRPETELEQEMLKICVTGINSLETMVSFVNRAANKRGDWTVTKAN